MFFRNLINNKIQYRWIRHSVQVLFVVLFLSPIFGFKFYYGTLISASIFGLTLTDPFSAIEFFFANFRMPLSLIISALIITVFFIIIGGRVFCGWVCPVYLVTEIAEGLRNRMNFLKHEFSRSILNLNLKYFILGLSLILCLITRVPVFELISPPGVLTRNLVFGIGNGISIIVAIVLFEVIISRRGWCRSLCPIGGFYSFVGKLSPVKINIVSEKCNLCRKCQKVCIVPEILTAPINFNDNRVMQGVISGECTYCLNCIDVCPEQAMLLRPARIEFYERRSILNETDSRV